MVNVKGAGRAASSDDDDGNTYFSGETEDASQQDYSQGQPSPDVSGVSSLRLEDDEKRARNYGLARSRGGLVTPRNDKISTNVTRQLHGSRQIRGIGPQSYVSLVKQTEDEMELVGRRRAGLTQPSAANRGIGTHPGEQEHKFKAERRSANAVTLLFERGRNIPHAAHIVHSTGTSSEHKLRPVNGGDSSDTEISFPLRNMASGESSNVVSIRKAKSLENAAKRKANVLKNDVGWAKLEVVEVKLTEFAATMEVRQAKLEGRQAKLYRRRAALKQAEEEQDSLEANMDAEEESHRARERKIKNRERRVKQEEAGLSLKESSLRKREAAISKGISKIERWRKIVDEKEDMQKRMEEIVERKEELHGRDMTAVNLFGALGPKLRSKKRNKDKTLAQPQSYSVRSGPSSLDNYPKPKARTSIGGSGYTKSSALVPDALASKMKDREKVSAIPGENEVKAGALSFWL